jgi:hypothetical protein
MLLLAALCVSSRDRRPSAATRPSAPLVPLPAPPTASFHLRLLLLTVCRREGRPGGWAAPCRGAAASGGAAGDASPALAPTVSAAAASSVTDCIRFNLLDWRAPEGGHSKELCTRGTWLPAAAAAAAGADADAPSDVWLVRGSDQAMLVLLGSEVGGLPTTPPGSPPVVVAAAAAAASKKLCHGCVYVA